MEKRIIATDIKLLPSQTGQLSEASRMGFEVMDLRKVKAAEKDKVEVLLIRDSNLIDERLFKDFPKVKLLQSMSAGVDFININAIPPGVILCSNAGAYKEPIAEHVFAMILFFIKNLTRNHERLRDGVFDNSPDGTSLAGKTLGVVGAGGIGQSVARIAKAFNMKTIGVNTTGKPVPGFDRVWRMRELDRLLKQSDFVILSLPLTVHTRNLMDAKKLALMKEDAILVNVARGPIISQSDLYSHLKSHPKFRVGLDVWWAYPRGSERFHTDLPFFELSNFLASPHVADGVPESNEHGQIRAFENLRNYIMGQPLERIIDRADYRGFKGANH